MRPSIDELLIILQSLKRNLEIFTNVLSKEAAAGFGGCAPPDQTHRYTIDVYALDTQLQLS